MTDHKGQDKAKAQPPSLLGRLFPPTQFYIRRRGTVQLFEFTSTFQLTASLAALLVLGWMSYASVVVIFYEQIIRHCGGSSVW